MAEKPLKVQQTTARTARPVAGEEVRPIPSRQTLTLLGIIAGLILVVVGGWFYFSNQKKAENQEASMALGKVTTLLSEGDYTKAIEGDAASNAPGLQSIVDDYGSTQAGKAAALRLGEAYMATDKYDEAAEAYDVASGSDDELVQAAALAGLASVAEAKGDFTEAASRYDKAASTYQSDIASPLYMLAAARNYESANNKNEAIARYREIVNRYPASEQNNDARFALARYGEEI